MGIQAWTALFVGLSFALYVGIALVTRVRTTKGFYVAEQGVPAVFNGMATAADWMSAASFISMAGLISFMGYTGGMYLMGWTGGYVLLALLLAPYLRKFGKFTVPDFVGDRYYSDGARLVAVFCAIFVSFTYVAGQMRGVGVVFSRFLEVDVNAGVVIGMVLVFFYATLGGMKGITWTQVAQYCVLIVAFLIPAVAISWKVTGNPIPQLGFGGTLVDGPNAGTSLLATIDALHRDLGFPEYTAAFVKGKKSMVDVCAITFALMVGTAGLPHVIIRFYTVPNFRAARWSALWALVFIGVLYTAAGLLLVISSAVAHDLGKRLLKPDMSEKEELLWARSAATAAVVVAGYLGIHPPGFVAQVVAFAFGLAASSFFPVIVLGIFYKRATREAGIAGMLVGILFTAAYIIYFKFIAPQDNNAAHWLWGISPEGIGSVGMVLNFGTMLVVSRVTPPPPQRVQDAVEAIRSPSVEKLLASILVLAVLGCSDTDATNAGKDIVPTSEDAKNAENIENTGPQVQALFVGDKSKPNADGDDPWLPGPHAVAGHHDKDVVIHNRFARYVIEGSPDGCVMAGTAGGLPVDAGRILDQPNWRKSAASHDNLRGVIFTMDSHQLRPSKVTIVSDGSDGAAVVRVEGELVPMPALADILHHEKPDIIAEHTFTLRPDSVALECTTTIRSKTDAKVELMVAEILQWDGERTLFLPGYGTSNLPPAGQFDTIGWVPSRHWGADLHSVSAAYGSAKKLSMIDAGAFRAFLHNGVTATKEGVTVTRFLAVGGTGDAEEQELAGAMAAIGQKTGKSGFSRVSGSIAVPIGIAFVDVLDSKGKPLTRCDQRGQEFDCLVPKEATALRQGWLGPGSDVGDGGNVGAKSTPIPQEGSKKKAIALPSNNYATLFVSVTDPAGSPKTHLPYRLTLVPLTDDGKPGDKLRRRTLAATGVKTMLIVPSGKSELWVHRGPFWSQEKLVMNLLPGDFQQLEVKLTPVVPHAGWHGADLHMHSEGSPDSRVPVDRRVVGAMAEGVRYLIATDHDHVTDYAKFASELTGLRKGTCGELRMGVGTGWVHTTPGIEVTTMNEGHYNSWPATPIAWHKLGPAGIFDAMGAGTGAAPTIQCNHPRSDTFSYFKAIDLQIGKTPAKLLRCDLVEVINGFEPEKTEEVLGDWLALLQAGVVWTATGASDCHKLKDFCGNPRTMVHVPHAKESDPCSLTAKELDGALKQGKAVATAGPMLWLTANVDGAPLDQAVGIGGTLKAKGKDVTLKAALKMAAWLPPGTLQVYVNGKKTSEKAVNSGLKQDGAWAVAVELALPATGVDQNVVAVHRPSGKPLTSPGTRVPPWAVTNPVWIQR